MVLSSWSLVNTAIWPHRCCSSPGKMRRPEQNSTVDNCDAQSVFCIQRGENPFWMYNVGSLFAGSEFGRDLQSTGDRARTNVRGDQPQVQPRLLQLNPQVSVEFARVRGSQSVVVCVGVESRAHSGFYSGLPKLLSMPTATGSQGHFVGYSWPAGLRVYRFQSMAKPLLFSLCRAAEPSCVWMSVYVFGCVCVCLDVALASWGGGEVGSTQGGFTMGGKNMAPNCLKTAWFWKKSFGQRGAPGSGGGSSTNRQRTNNNVPQNRSRLWEITSQCRFHFRWDRSEGTVAGCTMYAVMSTCPVQAVLHGLMRQYGVNTNLTAW